MPNYPRQRGAVRVSQAKASKGLGGDPRHPVRTSLLLILCFRLLEVKCTNSNISLILVDGRKHFRKHTAVELP